MCLEDFVLVIRYFRTRDLDNDSQRVIIHMIWIRGQDKYVETDVNTGPYETLLVYIFTERCTIKGGTWV